MAASGRPRAGYLGPAGTFTEVALRRDPDCPVCGEHPTITQYIDYVEFCAAA